ncbi:hypothetical protein LMOSLCC5850_1231 [Listeria monocytogenes SLCC5850]|uniref:Uncharacterized protein n=1 Tax=Listeria monocytogenes serotype 1/2a (strain EGD / Mackaness) TaxID=1334565 RepID=A0A3Q0NDR2_LISMG|nr:hypothetical protein LMOSLCC5850_1231 [Listeria monocytogenes SLCC5850]CDG45094.1 hypothetical protein LMON_1236 [Listeria monocytogenes EGD]
MKEISKTLKTLEIKEFENILEFFLFADVPLIFACFYDVLCHFYDVFSLLK